MGMRPRVGFYDALQLGVRPTHQFCHLVECEVTALGAHWQMRAERLPFSSGNDLACKGRRSARRYTLPVQVSAG